MESVFKINNFDSLDEDVQQDIQDFIAGYTTEWVVEFYSHCDACGLEKELTKIETEGGIIRVCQDCKTKRWKNLNA